MTVPSQASWAWVDHMIATDPAFKDWNDMSPRENLRTLRDYGRRLDNRKLINQLMTFGISYEQAKELMEQSNEALDEEWERDLDAKIDSSQARLQVEALREAT